MAHCVQRVKTVQHIYVSSEQVNMVSESVNGLLCERTEASRPASPRSHCNHGDNEGVVTCKLKLIIMFIML